MFSTKRHCNPGRAFGSRPKVEIWSPLIVESDYSPSTTVFSGRSLSASTIYGYCLLNDFRFLETRLTLPFELIATARYPSSLISYVVTKFMWRNT